MSGHSKWSTIKHKKGAEDKKRGTLFTKLSRAIIVAAKEGGPDPAANASLAAAIAKARSYSMPKDNIERAVQRGAGSGEGTDAYDAITYEGYGPEGVAIIVEALTDNRNRTAADVRAIFSKHNASLGTPGSVAWQFERKGIVLIPGSVDEDELMMVALEAGADDITLDGDLWQVTCEPHETSAVRAAIEEAGITVDSFDLTMLPTSTVALESAEAAKPVLRLIDALDDHDDVQDVFANFDIPDEVLAGIEA